MKVPPTPAMRAPTAPASAPISGCALRHLCLPEEAALRDVDAWVLALPNEQAPAWVAALTRARPDVATVHGVGLDGEPVTYSGDGLLARCLQHETDHLDGTVFGDRLPTKARKRLQKAHEKVAESYPDDWPVGVEPDANR